MIGRFYRAVHRCGQPYSLFRRQYTVKAIYSSFPATLHYYCPRRSSSLFNHEESDSRPDDLYEEGVAVQRHGLVYPAINEASVSNGAVFFPNTFVMQELVRQYFDEALEREEEGKEVETPFICTVSKGTPIPSHLILINEYISRFSLQPSHGMPLVDLNRFLDEFYDKHAQRETAEDWLNKHPYQSAVADDADPVWIAT